MKKLAEIIGYYSEENLERSKEQERKCKETYSAKEIKKFRRREKGYNILKSFATLGTVGGLGCFVGLGYFMDQGIIDDNAFNVYTLAIGTWVAGAVMGFTSIKRNDYRKILGIPYKELNIPELYTG